jgi:RNA polymerase sigma factor (sigma-70 family)
VVLKLGSQSALAEKLGEHPTTISAWCSLKSCPPVEPNRFWPKKRLDKIEKVLFELTGKTLEEIFPPELRENKALLKASKTFEKTRDIEIARLADATTGRLTLPDPSEHAEHQELAADVAEAMRTLSVRERAILMLRMGLGDGHEYTLEETGHILKITRERVRQLEIRALRKLKQPSSVNKLAHHWPGDNEEEDLS